MAKVDAAADSPAAASPNHSLPAGPVEARSLSSITAIASNPPAYPRNPTQKKLDPLVLYIVRVPGSKDVFLSPLKPPTKASVSAEAINASLYYLHVSTPEDDVLLQEYEQEREEEAKLRKEMLGEEADVPPEFARLNNVRRKPVPGGSGSAKVDADARPPLPARPSNLSLQENVSSAPNFADLPSSLMPARPALSGSCSSIDIPQAPSQMAADSRNGFLGCMPGDETAARPPLPARPLPPVPKDELAFELVEDNCTSKKPNRWSALSGYMPGRGMENWKEKYEVLSSGRHSLDSRRPQVRPQSSHANPSHTRLGSPVRSPGQSPSRRPHDSRQPEQPGFHITLIRRDPAHGSQWNVATISTSKIDGSAIDIEVSTPGYNRFAAKNEPLSLASLGLNLPSEIANRISLSSSSRPTPAELTENTPTQPSHPRKFHRKLCVSRPYQEETRGSLDLGNRTSIDIGSNSPTIKPVLSKLKSGYYTFTSPWNGTCTFSTSVNGRSLKCKHMIPMPPTGPNGGPIDNPAVTVAEIRFNTPFQAGHLHHQPNPSHISPFTLSQTPAFKDPTSNPNSHHASNMDQTTPSPPTTKRNSLAHFLNPNTYNRPRARSGASAHSVSSTSNFGVPTRKPSTSSTSSGAADLDDPSGPRRPPRRVPSDDRLDLSLARENAGGGMRGKSAKLGKLIIEDEGIKMLDLLVASCMAVWWRGYYY